MKKYEIVTLSFNMHMFIIKPINIKKFVTIVSTRRGYTK